MIVLILIVLVFSLFLVLFAKKRAECNVLKEELNLQNIKIDYLLEKKDKLDIIFEEQEKLDTKVVNEHGVIWYDKKAMIRDYVLALNDEVAELQREVTPVWKWWVNDMELNKEAVVEELIDILHFDISLLRRMGCNTSDIFNEYMEKNKENVKRQKGETDRVGYMVNVKAFENVD